VAVVARLTGEEAWGLRVLTDEDVALVTYDEAAEFCGVDPSRVRDWRRRELIFPADFDGVRPLFSLAEVWAAEAATRTGQGARRRS
jgi:hypothetical protein